MAGDGHHYFFSRLVDGNHFFLEDVGSYDRYWWGVGGAWDLGSLFPFLGFGLLAGGGPLVGRTGSVCSTVFGCTQSRRSICGPFGRLSDLLDGFYVDLRILKQGRFFLPSTHAVGIKKTPIEGVLILLIVGKSCLEKSDCKAKAKLIGFCFEWTSVGLPHRVEVVGSPHIKTWASGFEVKAIANFF